MAVETLFAEITHEAPSASRRETSLIPACCLCGRLPGETRASLDRERWVTQRTYRKIQGAHPADLPLTHTYCPKCFTQVGGRVRVA